MPDQPATFEPNTTYDKRNGRSEWQVPKLMYKGRHRVLELMLGREHRAGAGGQPVVLTVWL